MSYGIEFVRAAFNVAAASARQDRIQYLKARIASMKAELAHFDRQDSWNGCMKLGKDGTLECLPGIHFQDAKEFAEVMADSLRRSVSFKFNGDQYTVYPRPR